MGQLHARRNHRVGTIVRLQAGSLRRTPIQSFPPPSLDPFGGSGTVGLVADQLGRNAVIIEINEGLCCDGAEANSRRCTIARGSEVEMITHDDGVGWPRKAVLDMYADWKTGVVPAEDERVYVRDDLYNEAIAVLDRILVGDHVSLDTANVQAIRDVLAKAKG